LAAKYAIIRFFRHDFSPLVDDYVSINLFPVAISAGAAGKAACALACQPARLFILGDDQLCKWHATGNEQKSLRPFCQGTPLFEF
jgi:hypothetical protein